jgi:N-acetylmuramoyl-L-alanine amidase
VPEESHRNLKKISIPVFFLIIFFSLSGCVTVAVNPINTKKTALAARYIKKIVIDAGHGGKDPGAIGQSGLKEKSVTMDVVKRLKLLLEEKGFDVVLTRKADNFISLPKRVDISNNSKADLFVSIHANANRERDLSGFEIYHVAANSDHFDRRRQGSLSLSRYGVNSSSVCGDSLILRAVLWDLIRAYCREESVELASCICGVIGRQLEAPVLGIKSANFRVLKGARMPAILVEIGFISNNDEEDLLRRGSYRQQIARGITDGIIDYARAKDYAKSEVTP